MITSKDNNSVKLFRKLSGNKKYRAEEGAFPLEGLRLVRDAAMEGAKFRTVMASENFLRKMDEKGEKLDFIDESSILKISDGISTYIAITGGSQGIFAICEIPEMPKVSDILQSGGKYIVFHNIQDTGNMGTMIRTADAMGIDAAIIVDCCDLYSPKTVRATMGSLFRLKMCFAEEEEVFKALKEKNITSYAAVVGDDAELVTECGSAGGLAVFIGNEGNGLPERIVSQCGKKLTIPMKGNINSLNAATAASIIMWELTK